MVSEYRGSLTPSSHPHGSASWALSIQSLLSTQDCCQPLPSNLWNLGWQITAFPSTLESLPSWSPLPGWYPCFWAPASWHFFFFKNFYLFEREREQGVKQREWEKERISSRLCAEHRAQLGVWSQEPEIMTWTKTKSWTLNQLSHPGTPSLWSRNTTSWNSFEIKDERCAESHFFFKELWGRVISHSKMLDIIFLFNNKKLAKKMECMMKYNALVKKHSVKEYLLT